VIEPTDPRWEWASFGRVVEDFLSGPIGSHLIRKADEQTAEAVAKLKVVSAEDSATIRALQAQAQVADSVMQWLAEAVHEGQMALEHLKEESDE
jgi:hypothetical protein